MVDSIKYKDWFAEDLLFVSKEDAEECNKIARKVIGRIEEAVRDKK